MDDSHTPQHCKVSFAGDMKAGRSLRLSLVQLPDRVDPSRLIPQEVLTPKGKQCRQQHMEPTSEGRLRAAEDPGSGAVLIYPKKINDLKRFRMLFVGLLLFIVSSTQGVHSLFGTILLQAVYLYDVQQMMSVYLTGCAFGMFVFPFGVLYDWFGPRPVVSVCVVLTALGHLLFALMFRGDIDHTVRNSCLFYGIMCWGCYGLQVAVLPVVLTHMPRDRGQPISLLQTFSGLGSSLISCLFRGFFKNRFDNLMWFMFALTLVFGIIGIWYLENAPYIATRWQQRKLTPTTELRNHLIRNRYMSQLVPQRRYYLMSVALVILNFYLTIQAVTVAYKQDTMTAGMYRGIAIGAIFITLLCCILIVPLHAIDGTSPQDKEVILQAKRKEEELLRAQEERKREEWRAKQPGCELVDTKEQDMKEASTIVQMQAQEVDSTQKSRYVPIIPQRPQIEVTLTTDSSESDEDPAPFARGSTLEPHSGSPFQRRYSTLRASFRQEPFNHLSSFEPADLGRRESVVVTAHEPSTYDRPFVEVINVCGDVFVTPVYQTTFLESLTYVDLWMVFYNTLVIWGVGMTMTGSWNIQIMVSARIATMDYKMYILFAALTGVATAGGRVFLSVYERMLWALRENYGVVLVPIIGYPLASVGLFISMILWIALPGGNESLVTAYLLGPFFFGVSSSMTMYVLGTIFDKDLGMHYSFCFVGAAIGMIFFYYLSWFLPYQNASITIPSIGKRCIGERQCMNKTVGIYIAVIFSTIFTSYWVHWRYAHLVSGKLKHRRIIMRTLKRLLSSDNVERNTSLVNHSIEEREHANTCSPSH